jgi:hypothetical protein
MSSLYSQPPMMAQPYVAPSYPQRGSHPYQHNAYPPAPQAPFSMDPHTFRHEYARRLEDLTENSRPIIQHLYLFAQEYSRWSDIVGQCLEAHIRRVSCFYHPIPHYCRRWVMHFECIMACTLPSTRTCTISSLSYLSKEHCRGRRPCWASMIFGMVVLLACHVVFRIADSMPSFLGMFLPCRSPLA